MGPWLHTVSEHQQKKKAPARNTMDANDTKQTGRPDTGKTIQRTKTRGKKGGGGIQRNVVFRDKTATTNLTMILIDLQSSKKFTNGVPQGSVLGLLLIPVYINSIPLVQNLFHLFFLFLYTCNSSWACTWTCRDGSLCFWWRSCWALLMVSKSTALWFTHTET